MELAFNYNAKTSRGQALSGIVFAPNKPLAFASLRKGGLIPLKVSLNVGASINGLIHRDFNKSELSRFYRTLGRRLLNGKQLADGLESAVEYTQDARLRQAAMMMRQALIDGQSEFHAMKAAKFPNRDCLVVRSTGETGKTGETFETMGDELARAETLRKSMSATFRMPAIMGVFMVLFVWAAIMFIAPSTLAFLKQTGLKLNFSPLLANYFEFVEVFHRSATFSSIVYFGLMGACAYFLRSPTFKAMLDNIKTLRNLSIKTDHSMLWNSFCLLYDAGIPTREAALIVGDSAKRADARAAFYKMGKLVEGGRSLEDSVVASGFPSFITSGVSAAISSGDTIGGIRELVASLEEDVHVLSAILQENAKIGTTLVMGCGILLVFVLTYYPMLASVLSNL